LTDLKLFRIEGDSAVELGGSSSALERTLQSLIEHNMEPLFAVRFLATEYSTGRKHGGRIDFLGLDENGSPVIFEYKRARDENVINQGLFYLDWLLDHRAEFQLLVQARHLLVYANHIPPVRSWCQASPATCQISDTWYP
jgi:RecB family endonuclease NucS